MSFMSVFGSDKWSVSLGVDVRSWGPRQALRKEPRNIATAKGR